MNNQLFYFRTDYYKKSVHNFIYSPILGVLFFLLLFPFLGAAQVGINTNDINFSAILQIESTNKGVLFPTLTKDQRDAINTTNPDPVTPGLTIFCTNCCTNGLGSLYYYNGVAWRPLDSSCRDVDAGPECLDLVTTIVNDNHMKPNDTPPLFIDGLLHGNSQTNWDICKMHGDRNREDEVNFDFNQTLPAGYKIQLFFQKGDSGISGAFKAGGSTHQTVSSDLLPANATSVPIPGGENGDSVLTTTLLSNTDEVYVTANDTHPYLWEIKVFDNNDVEIPLTCN